MLVAVEVRVDLNNVLCGRPGGVVESLLWLRSDGSIVHTTTVQPRIGIIGPSECEGKTEITVLSWREFTRFKKDGSEAFGPSKTTGQMSHPGTRCIVELEE